MNSKLARSAVSLALAGVVLLSLTACWDATALEHAMEVTAKDVNEAKSLPALEDAAAANALRNEIKAAPKAASLGSEDAAKLAKANEDLARLTEVQTAIDAAKVIPDYSPQLTSIANHSTYTSVAASGKRLSDSLMEKLDEIGKQVLHDGTCQLAKDQFSQDESERAPATDNPNDINSSFDVAFTEAYIKAALVAVFPDVETLISIHEFATETLEYAKSYEANYAGTVSGPSWAATHGYIYYITRCVGKTE